MQSIETAAWNFQTNMVVSILKDRFGYDVVMQTDEQDRADFTDRIVYINSRARPEYRFYTILHEYGHVEINEVGGDSLEESVPCYKRFRKTRSARSHSGKIATIVEEIEAWRRGQLLAKSQLLYINEEKYEKCMNSSLMSYIEWAAGV